MDKARLTEALRDTYEQALRRHLADPERVRRVYSVWQLERGVADKLTAVAETAAQMLNAPGAAITLITDNIQRVVATYESQQQARPLPIEMPQEQTYCRNVMDGTMFEVGNAIEHMLVCDNLSTTEYGLRAYLGVPLLIGGYVVGAACVWDYEVRTWRASDVHVLASLAITASDLLTEASVAA